MPPVLKKIKRWLGIVWILLGPLAIFYLTKLASGEIAKKPGLETWIQWIVFIGIFIPIAIGMVIFGYYVLSGEYDDFSNNS
jgi:hypothetical protein